VAHQWWGHQLVATHGPGATFLTESLTKYSEIVALEKAYGREHVRQLLTYELDLYLAGRTDQLGDEPPLVRADNQSYLYYRKGSLVLYALKDLLGEPAVNAALRNLLLEQSGPDRNPTTAHFMQHLHAVSPPEHHALIDQWMTDVVLYDFKLESASSRPLPNGRHEVKLRITAAKQRADDTPLPMNEMIDIGVFAADDGQVHADLHGHGLAIDGHNRLAVHVPTETSGRELLHLGEHLLAIDGDAERLGLLHELRQGNRARSLGRHISRIVHLAASACVTSSARSGRCLQLTLQKREMSEGCDDERMLDRAIAQ
jgi:hypothetical protein